MVLQQFMKALSQAVRENDVKTVRAILLKEPELLKHPNHLKDGPEFLRQAICLHHNEIVEHLVKSGVDLNSAESLKAALFHGNLPAVECLVENGARLKDQISLIKYVFTRYLHRYSPNFYKDKDSNDLLSTEMSMSTSRKILTLLVQHGLVDTEFKYPTGDNYLHIFVDDFLYEKRDIKKDYHNALAIAEILINSGIPVDEINGDGFSLLTISIVKNDLKWVEFLVKKGADVNLKNKDGYMFPLLPAVRADDEAIIRFLISYGADVKMKDTNGWTTLHEAFQDHQHRIIKLLLRKGAVLDAEDEQGRLPMDMLKSDKKNYEMCFLSVIEVFSLMDFQKKPIQKSYSDLLKRSSQFQEIHNSYMEKFDELKNNVFYAPFTYYHVLKMSENIRKLATLLRNEDLVKGFKSKLSSLSFMRDEIQRLFDEAEQVKDEMIIVESRLKNVFGYYLPDIVIDKLSEILTVYDLPLE